MQIISNIQKESQKNIVIFKIRFYTVTKKNHDLLIIYVVQIT